MIDKKRDPNTQQEWLDYRKKVRFVMSKLNKEKDDAQAEIKWLMSRIDKLEAKLKEQDGK